LVKFELLYVAVIVCDPDERAFVVTDATPPESATVPRTVLPLLNVTVPIGVTSGELTVAVKVTS